MFRIQDLSSIPSAITSEPNTSGVRLFSVALLSLIMSLGFVSPAFHSGSAEAGTSHSGVKTGGGKKVQMRSMRSGGKRIMRSGGSKRASGMRVGGSRRLKQGMSGGKSSSRIYTKRRSVLDGQQQRVGGKRHANVDTMRGKRTKSGTNIRRVNMGGKHGDMGRKGRNGGNRLLNRVNNRNTNVNRNTNTNNVTIKNNINLSIGGGAGRNVAKRRSGVTYSRSYKNASGLREVAGSARTVIRKRRLRGGKHRGDHGVATGFSAGGLVVIAGAASSNPAPVAGGDDCAYGTYCTIDLGGPKIITLNDVADYSENDGVDDEYIDGLSDEELERKYGTK